MINELPSSLQLLLSKLYQEHANVGACYEFMLAMNLSTLCMTKWYKKTRTWLISSCDF